MFREILYGCKIDKSRQSAMFRASRPLPAGLHVWSHCRKYAALPVAVNSESVPPHLSSRADASVCGVHKVLLRKAFNHIRLTVFDGKHDLYEEAALKWLFRQVRGTRADWIPEPVSAADNQKNEELKK